MSQQNDSQKFLFGLMLGAAAGAAVALLLPPAMTEETKRKIAERITPIKDTLNKGLFNGKIDQATLSGLFALVRQFTQTQQSAQTIAQQPGKDKKAKKSKPAKKESKKNTQKQPE